jgi:hypothetical protein
MSATTTLPADADLEDFRARAVAFLAQAQADELACPAYGAILPPVRSSPTTRSGGTPCCGCTCAARRSARC